MVGGVHRKSQRYRSACNRTHFSGLRFGTSCESGMKIKDAQYLYSLPKRPRRCFTCSELEPLAPLDGCGRLYRPLLLPARNTFANMFRLFLLTTTHRAKPHQRKLLLGQQCRHNTNTSQRVLKSRSQLVTSIASVQGVVRACSNPFS